MKSKGTAYLLCLLGFIGIAGLQYFYLGKVLKGIIWFFTIGLLGVGTTIDLFTLGSQVDNYNTKEELKVIRTNAIAAHQNSGRSNHE